MSCLRGRSGPLSYTDCSEGSTDGDRLEGLYSLNFCVLWKEDKCFQQSPVHTPGFVAGLQLL